MEGRTSPRRALKPNPPWITRVIANHYEFLESKVPPEWLPKLDKVRIQKGQRMTARMKEFGCGAYGCVLPTLDDGVVLKITTDPGEAHFAAHLANTLVAPVTVDYLMVVSVSDEHMGARIEFLWRESAQDVDGLGKIAGKKAVEAVRKQHHAASQVLLFLRDHKPSPVLEGLLDTWKRSVVAMGDVKELEYVANGMCRVYAEQGIAFLDVHEGNLGRVHRAGRLTWVITDPGNVVVIEGDTMAYTKNGRELEGGLAAGMSPRDFDPTELERGTRVEMEHTSDRRVAQRIAMDHLVEDPLYYRKLAKLHL